MFKFFKKNKKGIEDLKEVLVYIRQMEKRINKLSADLDIVRAMVELSLQKVGLVRFNPFKDMGGDQSFSIALLDSKNNGLAISSLYLKEGNRIYTKPIKNGESEYSLSEEEKKAVQRAINQ